MTLKHAQQALHSELVEVGLDEEVDGIGEREAPWKWLTFYEMENAVKATEAVYDTDNHVPMTGDMEKARFDVRTYEEVQRWQQGDWEGDHTEVVSVAVMEWQIEEGKEKEVLDFYKSEAAPTIASSPDTLRFRLFKIINATVLQADSYKTLERKKLHKYLTIAELASEEWPWDVVVKLGEKPQWIQYFEGQKVVHYYKKYPYTCFISVSDSEAATEKRILYWKSSYLAKLIVIIKIRTDGMTPALLRIEGQPDLVIWVSDFAKPKDGKPMSWDTLFERAPKTEIMLSMKQAHDCGAWGDDFWQKTYWQKDEWLMCRAIPKSRVEDVWPCKGTQIMKSLNSSKILTESWHSKDFEWDANNTFWEVLGKQGMSVFDKDDKKLKHVSKKAKLDTNLQDLACQQKPKKPTRLAMDNEEALAGAAATKSSYAANSTHNKKRSADFSTDESEEEVWE
ncbi:hypothetical protein E8E13_003797 [Curvularia kusanoi]|uniref:Uncharacterized protein n=1 Tax=Curvularia kusanoi TaxID=90978 RepID=A0A9P4TAW9_CURKU|nr:hypothetical protein E8E13_003797 [Curvularia kusanoi]